MTTKKKLTEYLNQKEKTYFSFELLPPLKGHTIQKIYDSIDPLMEFNPININVTYHQEEVIYKKHKSGLMQKQTVRKRPGTVAISAAINNKYKDTIVVPHMICGGFTKEHTEDALIDLHFLGVSNLLLLRGDAQKSQQYFTPEEGGHSYTLGLIEQVRNMNKGKYLDEELLNSSATNFTIGVAGYPEKHIEAPNLSTDMKYLKMKVDAGAEYIVTQMFFDNKKYFDFVKNCRKAGITVPIVPGIKPVRSSRDLQLLPQVFNIDIPQDLVNEIEKQNGNKEAINKVGIEWAIQQSLELKKAGVPVIHYYTIGRPDNVRQIAKAVF